MEKQPDLKVQIEKPRLSYPVSLVIDDGEPCINPLYYYCHQVRPEEFQQHEEFIPLDLMEQFAEMVVRHGIKGKFTVIPYPAGLGTILDGWEGCDREEMRHWLELARAVIARQFDITPEILTHTLALDLKTHQLLPQSEQSWMDERNAAELEEYMRVAVDLLRSAGFSPTGITQPVTFKGDRAAYAKAALESIRPTGANPEGTVTFYFIDFEDASIPVPPHPVVLMDREKSDAVISLLCYSDDFFWNTQYPSESEVTIFERVDNLISADGRSGRLVELLRGGAWATFITHWQSLYSNGTRLGLAGINETASRLARTFGPRLLWVTNGEIARYRAAEEACIIKTAAGDALEIDSGFACPNFTLTFQAAALSAAESIGVVISRTGEPDQPLPRDKGAEDSLMQPGSWRQTGANVSVCFDLQRGVQCLRLV